jgi:ABC-type uncharacterized transport system permease subunit
MSRKCCVGLLDLLRLAVCAAARGMCCGIAMAAALLVCACPPMIRTADLKYLSVRIFSRGKVLAVAFEMALGHSVILSFLGSS